MEIWLHITEMALEIHKRKLVCICIVSMKIEIMLPTLSIAHIIRYQPMKWNSIHLKRETIPNPRFLGYLSRMFSQYALQLIDIEQNQVQALIRKKKFSLENSIRDFSSTPSINFV